MNGQAYDTGLYHELGHWHTQYHKASSVLRHGGGSHRELIEGLTALNVPVSFKHILVFNVCIRGATNLYDFHIKIYI